MKKKIRLGVNIDHAATLRQVRGGSTDYPDLLKMSQLAIGGGADQITIHLREDRRHIQLLDLALLAKECPVPLNLEMANTDGMVRLANKYKPDWVCFVPEKRQELTTEGGLDVFKNMKSLAPSVERLQRRGIEISMFIGPVLKQVKASFEAGADAIEFHTGHWVCLQGKKRQAEWERLCECAQEAHQLGMAVHAGHGLSFQTASLIRKLPHLEEVNIGHSLICYALEFGLQKAVQMMRRELR